MKATPVFLTVFSYKLKFCTAIEGNGFSPKVVLNGSEAARAVPPIVGLRRGDSKPRGRSERKGEYKELR
jgi:hypothetical protein